MTVAWPLEDQVFQTLSQPERDDWNGFYHRMSALAQTTGRYYPFIQTNWY